MSLENSVPKGDQDQLTYENLAEARRVIVVDSVGGTNSPSNPNYVQDTPFYKQITDSTNPFVVYNGYAVPGTATSDALWLITRMTISGSIVTIEFADGDTSFDNIWDNRSSLSYS